MESQQQKLSSKKKKCHHSTLQEGNLVLLSPENFQFDIEGADQIALK